VSATEPPRGGLADARASAGKERRGSGRDNLASSASSPAPVAWPDGFTAAACLTFDMDAEAAVLTADISSVYRMSPMSHQAYGPLVGIPRILDLLARHGVLEVPVWWGLDDWEQYAFLPDLIGTGVIESPAKALEMWSLELDAMYAIGAAFVLTCHPFLSGRPARAYALEQLIERMARLPGLWITTVGDVARHVASLDLTPRACPQPVLPADAYWVARPEPGNFPSNFASNDPCTNQTRDNSEKGDRHGGDRA
jgi:hypothetical protein